jgi:hypothetical protein
LKYINKVTIPRQVENTEATVVTTSLVASANTGLKAALVTKLALSQFGAKLKTAFKSAMGEVMGTIGFLQLVVFLPLIKVKYPGNARLINDYMIQIATFDLLPTDDIYPQIFEF